MARILPIGGSGGRRDGVDERLMRLERQGLIRRGTGGLPAWARRPPRRARGSVLRKLLEEREPGW